MIRRLEAPPITEQSLEDNPVYLVSADLPGCGSSTLAKSIAGRITEIRGEEPYFIETGQALRQLLDVKNEADFVAKLKEIPNPREYDAKVYDGLATDRPCVVDGKLATTAGPNFIEGRPVVAIDLTSNFLTSAKRIAQREGKRFAEIVNDPEATQFLGHIALIKNRAEHDMELRRKLGIDPELPDTDRVQRYKIDTSLQTTAEILEYFGGDTGKNLENYVPSWEIDALKSTSATLAYLHEMLDDHIHPTDLAHYRYQHQSLRYNLERLMITLNPEGISDIREQLRKSIIDCWFGLMMKETPRFFTNEADELTLDTKSHKWTPEFYKIAEGWPTLSTMLRGKEILDPFAGAGTLAHLLVAREIVEGAHLSDKAFKGGEPLDNEGNMYDSGLNSQMMQILFDELPSWYKPDFTKIKSRVSADALDLPHNNKSVDYVVTDPPYGKNLKEGGVGLLIGALREFSRVSREGSVLLVPMDWVNEIENSGQELTRLTGDVSRGHSKFPVCYIHIPSNNH